MRPQQNTAAILKRPRHDAKVYPQIIRRQALWLFGNHLRRGFPQRVPNPWSAVCRADGEDP